MYDTIKNVNSRSRGLTIGELLIASALLGLLIVTIMVMFGQMMAASTKNTLLATGSYFAEGVLEKTIAEGIEDEAATFAQYRIGKIYNQDITTTDPASKTKFIYRVTAYFLDSPASFGDPPLTPPGERWYIEVDVAWWQGQDSVDAVEAKAGYGKLNLKRGRVPHHRSPLSSQQPDHRPCRLGQELRNQLTKLSFQP